MKHQLRADIVLLLTCAVGELLKNEFCNEVAGNTVGRNFGGHGFDCRQSDPGFFQDDVVNVDSSLNRSPRGCTIISGRYSWGPSGRLQSHSIGRRGPNPVPPTCLGALFMSLMEKFI